MSEMYIVRGSSTLSGPRVTVKWDVFVTRDRRVAARDLRELSEVACRYPGCSKCTDNTTDTEVRLDLRVVLQSPSACDFHDEVPFHNYMRDEVGGDLHIPTIVGTRVCYTIEKIEER